MAVPWEAALWQIAARTIPMDDVKLVRFVATKSIRRKVYAAF
jgi:hypothetical protein